MQPFLLLLLLAYSVTPTFTSAVSPNIVDRGDTRTSYTVMPADSANTASIETQLHMAYGDTNAVTHQKTETLPKRSTQIYNALAVHGSDVKEVEAFLRTKVGIPSRILQHKTSDEEVTGWSWLVLAAGALEEVEAHKGIGDVELMKIGEFFGSPVSNSSFQPLGVVDPGESHPTPQPPLHARSSPDDLPYRAFANKSSDAKETDIFLRSKVVPPFVPERFTDKDGNIVGWYNLVLDDAAAKEVSEYKGIRSDTFKRSKRNIPFRALETLRLSEKRRSDGYELAEGIGGILPRATEWEKQAGADKALIMDSQYQ
jgi:hypothetical protein